MSGKVHQRNKRTHKRFLIDMLAKRMGYEASPPPQPTWWVKRYHLAENPVGWLRARGIDLRIEYIKGFKGAKHICTVVKKNGETVELREPIALFPSETLVTQLLLLS